MQLHTRPDQARDFVEILAVTAADLPALTDSEDPDDNVILAIVVDVDVVEMPIEN